MPTRATDNPLVVPLLGLLLEQPRHPYALLADLRARYSHLTIRTSSVYTLLNSLEDVGWIAPTQRTGPAGGLAGDPLEVTPVGIAEFRRKVVADLEDTEPASAARFITALAYVGILDRKAAADTLRRRVRSLHERLEHLDTALRETSIHPVHMLEVDFAASQLRHDITWTEDFLRRISDPGYNWPTKLEDA